MFVWEKNIMIARAVLSPMRVIFSSSWLCGLLLLGFSSFGSLSYGVEDSSDAFFLSPLSIEIMSRQKKIYVSGETKTLVVTGTCSRHSEGGAYKIELTLVNTKYQTGCVSGKFAQQVSVDDLVDGLYMMQAFVIGTSTLDTASDRVTLIKDTEIPRLLSFGIVFAADETYVTGDVIEITFLFTEHIDVAGSANPELNLIIGSGVRTGRIAVAPMSEIDGNRMVFRYMVGKQDQDLDGIIIYSVNLEEVELVDLAGNKAVGSWGTGNMLPIVRTNIFIDTSEPHITSIVPLLNGTYVTGETITLQAIFTKAVRVDSVSEDAEPRLLLRIGNSENKVARFFGASDNVIIFHYPVVSGDKDTDGIEVVSLDSHSALITDLAGNRASTTLPYGQVILSEIFIDTEDSHPVLAVTKQKAETLTEDDRIYLTDEQGFFWSLGYFSKESSVKGQDEVAGGSFTLVSSSARTMAFELGYDMDPTEGKLFLAMTGLLSSYKYQQASDITVSDTGLEFINYVLRAYWQSYGSSFGYGSEVGQYELVDVTRISLTQADLDSGKMSFVSLFAQYAPLYMDSDFGYGLLMRVSTGLSAGDFSGEPALDFGGYLLWRINADYGLSADFGYRDFAYGIPGRSFTIRTIYMGISVDGF